VNNEYAIEYNIAIDRYSAATALLTSELDAVVVVVAIKKRRRRKRPSNINQTNRTTNNESDT
jgi:hypothetical protein